MKAYLAAALWLMTWCLVIPHALHADDCLRDWKNAED